MIEQLQALQERALARLQEVAANEDLARFENWRVEFLGKKGELSTALRAMGSLSAAERPLVGQVVNDVRAALESAYTAAYAQCLAVVQLRQEESEALDVTLAGRTPFVGAEHPLQKVIRRIEEIFVGFGFTVEEGPEVELDYYNFEAMNFPKDHPARDMQDTFFVGPDLLLRTHTSPVQARTMEKRHPQVPVRIIAPGKTYRRDDDDATHSHAFSQVEGLVIDHGVRMSDLKGMLLAFARQMYGENQEVRLRPSFFPFTEPSAELDVRCIYCGGSGCNTCKQTGWIEILGCGMVHPNVLRMGGYDPAQVSGFAFGMGVERVAMLLYQVTDIRQFYLNDLRLLQQFVGLIR
ncbi:MAG: phenylalanine--tRNA ligase subunit alpha [Firmicutes bacterium]|nr:phenylalanine--tRNA ligase subunit alpha [Bacillota bacterium]